MKLAIILSASAAALLIAACGSRQGIPSGATGLVAR
jgi:hypothetical protein